MSQVIQVFVAYIKGEYILYLVSLRLTFSRNNNVCSTFGWNEFIKEYAISTQSILVKVSLTFNWIAILNYCVDTLHNIA